jgi:hypothetical protein
MPPVEEQRRVIECLRPLYKPISTPKFLEKFDRSVFREYVHLMLKDIKREAGPGVPYSKAYKTNGDFIDYATPLLVNAVLDRVELLSSTSISELTNHKPEELVAKGFMDPVRLFIKNEPHKAAKVVQGRFRLIMSVSLVDKIIEMLFNRHYNKAQIANWSEIPSKPGMGFTEEANRKLIDTVRNFGVEKLVSADISGWDWSTPDWLIGLEAEFRAELNTTSSEYFRDFLYKKAFLETNSVYCLSNGMMLKLPFPGVQNSGKYNTSSSNSWMRLAASMFVGSEWGFAMGDDCIETFSEDAIAKYGALGFDVKMYEPIGTLESGFEFCSHIYSTNGVYSVNAVRGVMTLLNHSGASLLEKRLLTLQFEDDYKYSPEWVEIAEGLERVGWYAQTKSNKSLNAPTTTSKQSQPRICPDCADGSEGYSPSCSCRCKQNQSAAI